MTTPLLALPHPPTPFYLDLGSGPEPAPGHVGVDLLSRQAPLVVAADLWSGERWPFEDESVDGLRASHVIEHIPHGRIPTGERVAVRRTVRRRGAEPVEHRLSLEVTADPFFWFFDEAFRVAKPGARFELVWPHPCSDGADQDPTHQRRIPAATLHYLSRAGRRAMAVRHYPVSCDWRVAEVVECGSPESLRPFTDAEDRLVVDEARRHWGVFHEIRAVLVKPERSSGEEPVPEPERDDPSSDRDDIPEAYR